MVNCKYLEEGTVYQTGDTVLFCTRHKRKRLVTEPLCKWCHYRVDPEDEKEQISYGKLKY